LERKKEEKNLPKENAFLLVFAFEDISIRPELSIPPGFRIQGGGVPWALRRRTNKWTASACKQNCANWYIFFRHTRTKTATKLGKW